jgi:hypothetical protein
MEEKTRLRILVRIPAVVAWAPSSIVKPTPASAILLRLQALLQPLYISLRDLSHRHHPILVFYHLRGESHSLIHNLILVYLPPSQTRFHGCSPNPIRTQVLTPPPTHSNLVHQYKITRLPNRPVQPTLLAPIPLLIRNPTLTIILRHIPRPPRLFLLKVLHATIRVDIPLLIIPILVRMIALDLSPDRYLPVMARKLVPPWV